MTLLHSVFFSFYISIVPNKLLDFQMMTGLNFKVAFETCCNMIK